MLHLGHAYLERFATHTRHRASIAIAVNRITQNDTTEQQVDSPRHALNLVAARRENLAKHWRFTYSTLQYLLFTAWA
jgi:hypothetical protein